jgi:threonine synthase
MGLHVHQFIAATNANDVVPQYLDSGVYTPRPSVRTISNAMDVGNPSNFTRMMDLFGFTWNDVKGEIKGYAYSDEETKEGMQEVFTKYKYVIDPHGAVGYLALKEYQQENKGTCGVILETAHPSKFLDDVESILGIKVEIPERLAVLANKEKVATQMSIHFNDFKDWLISNY